jgi:hypothetical protein
MDEGPVDGAGAEAGPAPSGDTGSEATTQEPVAEPEPRQYVEVDDPDKYYVRVPVNGQTDEIPLSEALKGYSRTADYTQKTQALAEQRQEAEYALNLQRALQANPEMTLQVLSQQYGLAHQNQAPMPEPDEVEYSDPLERQLNEERSARQALEQRINERDADALLHNAVGQLRQQFGVDDDDVRQIVGTAYQLGLGVDALPMIYKTMAFDRISARVAAQQAETQRQQAETARRQAAASDASRTIGNGGSANGLTDRLNTAGQPMTIRDALDAAFKQIEGR